MKADTRQPPMLPYAQVQEHMHKSHREAAGAGNSPECAGMPASSFQWQQWLVCKSQKVTSPAIHLP